MNDRCRPIRADIGGYTYRYPVHCQVQKNEPQNTGARYNEEI
jgi:hypothetical protein